MNKKAYGRVLMLAGTVCIVLAIVAVILFFGREQKTGTKIGFVMTGSMEEAGWNGMHYEGVKAACDKLGTILLVKEHVQEFSGECIESIRQLADDGAGMIILSSYGYSEEAREVIKEYPQITFYVNSSEYHDVNMTSYFARMYQARYLAGIVAGMKTASGRIGYVAAMENNEVNRGINAFTMGVRRVNLDAEVVVKWTGAWDDEEKEKQAAYDLINNVQADVLTYHQNRTNVVEVAESEGVYSIGYHIAPENASEKNLTTVSCNWDQVYEEIIRAYMVGKGNIKDNYWIGLEVDAVGLSPYSSEVSEAIVQEVEQAKQEMLSGWDVFTGTIFDNTGALRCGEKETIGDEVILEQFDWFVEGVRIYER